MAKDSSLHQYSHVLANLLRGGQTGALTELYVGVMDELRRGVVPDVDDLLLLLETMGAPVEAKQERSDRQEVMAIIKTVMLLLEQDDFHQGVKSYHLNLLKREPINALEKQLKTRNFVDVLNMLNRK